MINTSVNCDRFFHAKQSYFLVCLAFIYSYVLLLYTELVSCMDYLFPMHLHGVQSRIWLGSLGTVARYSPSSSSTSCSCLRVTETEMYMLHPFSFLWTNSEQLRPLIKVNDHIPLILLRGGLHFLDFSGNSVYSNTWESCDVFCMQMLKEVFLYSCLLLFLFSFGYFPP